MLLIFEGVDGAGKTTLIERVAERLNDPLVLRRGPLREPPLVEYERCLEELDVYGRDVLCDRWHWGELIYGPLYRGRSELTQAMRIHVELFLRSRGAVIVHCVAPIEVVRRRLHTRGESFLQPAHVEHVMTRYERLVEDSLVDTYRIDTSVVQPLDDLLRLVRAKARVCAPLRAHPTYVGGPRPRAVLLGERRNRPDFAAAFTPGDSTSGRWLLDSLPYSLLERRLGIANALEEDVEKLWTTLERPRLVTLGRLAHERVEALGFSHSAVPHPQYVRRFHHSQLEEYGELVAAAARFRLEALSWPS